jgi:hypothetical protein
LHLSDNAGRYLHPAGGPLTGDVVDLVRPELRFELRSALHRVFESSRSSLSPPIPVRFNGSPHRVLMQVKLAKEQDDDKARKAVILFIEGGPEGVTSKWLWIRPMPPAKQSTDSAQSLRRHKRGCGGVGERK